MRSSSRGTLFILITLVLIYDIAPIISRFISTYLTTYFYMFIVMLVFLIVIRSSQDTSLNQYLNQIFPLLVLQLFSAFVGHDTILMWSYKTLLFILPMVLGIFLVYNNTYNNREYVFIIAISIIITIITTIQGVIQNPYASRYLATSASSDDYLTVMYNWKNIGGYGFVYTVTLLYPLWIFSFKRKKTALVPFVVGSISILYMLIECEYTTALLLYLISSVFIFLKRKLKTKNLIFLLILSFIAIYILSDRLPNLLLRIASLTGSDTMSMRLSALAGGKKGLESTDDKRLELYLRSINTFLSHPILGTFLAGGSGVGGHSAIFDTLARYGIVGLLLLYKIYQRIYILFYRPYRDSDGFGYILWFFVQTIILSCINTGLWIIVLALYAPIIINVIYEDELDSSGSNNLNIDSYS